jgi:ABC-2 type transport system ATP-binding protein
MTDAPSVLAVTNVSKTFGSTRAVDDVSFAVRRGRICGLLGRNGAGKTTTLRMINSVFLPDCGSITLFGSSEQRDSRDKIGYLPEERGLYRKMTVLEQLLFFAEIKRRRAGEARSGAQQWLERLELWPLRDAKLEELSKGNQQKVQLIAALLHEPELLVLDEPMSGLDPVNIVLVRQILKELAAAGRAILLSTHQMAEAEKLVDEIVLIHAGRVVLAGELETVRSSFGQNTLHVGFAGDGAALSAAPGVARAVVHGHAAELKLTAGADPQETLAFLLPRVRLTRFEVAAPSLEEIFIAQTGAETLGVEAVS